MKAVFFEADDVSEAYFREHLPGIDISFIQEPLSKGNIHHALNADIISTVVQSRLTPDILEALPQLKFITTRSTGYDHIDLEACKKRNILVSYAPNYGT
ncbi:MAG TPA: hydroxyacid dehydrogenase, partial [Candidatus Nanoarchaeia archaeon]|nr:hydroxyacid dehydrogenase [Candidatus Nanoarchaeia archaeon]